MREWRYSSFSIDLGNRWRWVVRFTSRPPYTWGKNPRYPLDRRLGGLQRRSGRSGVEKKLFVLPEIEFGRPARRPSLYRLSYPGSFCRMYLYYIYKFSN
jgi:hypothetical protein